jgi:SAM-dependent methyltransferase
MQSRLALACLSLLTGLTGLTVLTGLTACRGELPVPAPAAQAAAVPEPVSPAPAAEPRVHRSWDEIYADGIGFNTRPAKVLIDAVSGVTPGKALDIGMGQGRNAVFLATKGWDVTGVDLSAEGVKIAARSAAAASVRVNGIVEDIHTYDLGRERWDLIALIYMEERGLMDAIKAALKPGGRVVIEYFHEDSNDYFPHPIKGFATGELERIFAGYQILRSEIIEDVADFGERPAKLVRFVAQKG